MVSRLKLQYCKVIIATSLVWFLLDVFLLTYYTDCTLSSENCDKAPRDESKAKSKDSGGGGLLNKLIPNGEFVCVGGETNSLPWKKKT